MEDVKVKEWLARNSGYGFVSGDGSGYGYGSGSGLKSLNGQQIFMIDCTPTIITHIKLNLARGYVVEGDLSLVPCYVAKGEGLFAHGETAKEAQKALMEKIYENMDPEEAIEKFKETFKKDEKYKGHEFFEWHHYLTGSCKLGRESFVRNHGFDLDDLYTVQEFISACENDYGGEVIKKLKEKYGFEAN